MSESSWARRDREICDILKYLRNANSNNIEIKKEDIYSKIQASRQTKINLLKDLIIDGYVIVTKVGAHNTQYLKITEKGIRKLQLSTNYDNDSEIIEPDKDAPPFIQLSLDNNHDKESDYQKHLSNEFDRLFANSERNWVKTNNDSTVESIDSNKGYNPTMKNDGSIILEKNNQNQHDEQKLDDVQSPFVQTASDHSCLCEGPESIDDDMFIQSKTSNDHDNISSPNDSDKQHRCSKNEYIFQNDPDVLRIRHEVLEKMSNYGDMDIDELYDYLIEKEVELYLIKKERLRSHSNRLQ